MLRRNAFSVPAKKAAMPVKGTLPAGDRITKSVSREVAEMAAHLTDNPVFVDLFNLLRSEAVDRLTNSPLGPSGDVERAAARYELEALSTLHNRLGALAAENVLKSPTQGEPDPLTD